MAKRRQSGEEVREILVERLRWQAARRNDGQVAQAVHAGEELEAVFPLGEMGLLDEVLSFSRRQRRPGAAHGAGPTPPPPSSFTGRELATRQQGGNWLPPACGIRRRLRVPRLAETLSDSALALPLGQEQRPKLPTPGNLTPGRRRDAKRAVEGLGATSGAIGLHRVKGTPGHPAQLNLRPDRGAARPQAIGRDCPRRAIPLGLKNARRFEIVRAEPPRCSQERSYSTWPSCSAGRRTVPMRSPRRAISFGVVTTISLGIRKPASTRLISIAARRTSAHSGRTTSRSTSLNGE
jgi:hypothetical protein